MTTTDSTFDWAEDAQSEIEGSENSPFSDLSTEFSGPLSETLYTVENAVVMVDPHVLKVHPRNREVYGDQPAPNDLMDSIRLGWNRTSILEALPDGTLISGHLRRFAAIQLHVAQVPVLYRDDLTDDEAAQVEELLRANAGRVKSRETICREWRLAFGTFKTDVGSVSGQKSRDVVGARFGVSGVTLEHGIAVVNFLDGKGDVEVKDKVRKALGERGVEPAWKILRKAQSQDAQGGPSDEAQTPEGDAPVSLGMSPAKRHKALLEVLATVDARMPVLLEPESLVAAIAQEDLDDTLAAVQNLLIALGNIEGEIRDRLDSAKRRKNGRRGA